MNLISIVCGLPGAGKSTLIDSLPTATGSVWREAEPWATPDAVEAELSWGEPGWGEQTGSARLGTVLTVIAADTFWPQLHSARLAPRDDGDGGDDGHGDENAGRTVADVLIDQLEGASVIVVSRVDLVSDAELRRILELVRLLNPLACRAVSIRGELGSRLLPSPRSDLLERVRSSPGWIAELNREGSSRTGGTGCGAVVYRDPRFFHPQRLADFFEHGIETVGDVVRSKGLFRLASRPEVVGSWSSAGPMVTFAPTALDPADPETAFGQELVFFGADLDADRLTRALNDCLLDDEEFCAGPSAWRELGDPFPEWDLRRLPPRP